MANLLSNIIEKVVSSSPTVQRLRGELAARNAMFDHQNAGALKPGAPYQIVDPGSGNLKGVGWLCQCGQNYRLLSMFEIFRQGYKCVVCKRDINVLRHIGAVDSDGTFKIKAPELEALVMRLPVRPADGSSSVPRFLDSDDAEIHDDCAKVSGRDRAFESGDPGYSGLF